jgi:hypothetical protein
VWARVPDSDAFAGASMVDVVSSGSGLVAVGCQAILECSSGRVWRSTDGTTWEVTAEMTMIPFSVTQTPDGFVATGTDSDIGGRGATATSPDGTTWTVEVAEARPGSLNDAEVFGDTVLAAGQTAARRNRDDGVLRRWTGEAWEQVSSGRFEGSVFKGLGTSDSMIVLTGSREEDGVTVPFSLWSSDLDTYLRGRFPRPNEATGATVNSAAFSADGSFAVAVGVLEDDRPAAWYSELGAGG